MLWSMLIRFLLFLQLVNAVSERDDLKDRQKKTEADRYISPGHIQEHENLTRPALCVRDGCPPELSWLAGECLCPHQQRASAALCPVLLC